MSNSAILDMRQKTSSKGHNAVLAVEMNSRQVNTWPLAIFKKKVFEASMTVLPSRVGNFLRQKWLFWIFRPDPGKIGI